MAETNPKVMAMIEAELARDSSISNDELLEKAKKIDRSVGNLSARQFNARYPLQVKRRKDGPKPARKKPAGRKKKKAPRAGKASGAGKTSRAASSRKPGRKKAASGATRRPRTAAAPASGGDREAVRKILLDYAKKVSAADSMTDMVDLVMDVDRYVDRVMKAAS